MKHSALLALAALAPALPAVARAAEADADVRATLGQGILFGSLSPVQGAIATGLVVFALGCVVAIVVARRLDRGAGRPRAAGSDPDSSYERTVSPFFSGQDPRAFAQAEVASRTSTARMLPAPTSASTRDPRTTTLVLAPPTTTLALPAPASASLPGASNARPSEDEHEHTIVGFPPPHQVPAERTSQRRIVERSGVVPSARAIGLASGQVADAEVVYEPGNDPDATTQFVRGSNGALDAVLAELEAEAAPKTSTILPPAKVPTIRPIPISPPRAEARPFAPANVSELSFDDSPTEIGTPLFEEMSRELAKSSEVRALGGASADETQAFLLVKSG